MLDPRFCAALKTQLPDARAFFDSFEQPLPVAVRLNPQKAALQLPLQTVPWAAQAYYLSERPGFIYDPRWHAGAYYVQDASCLMLEWVVRHLKPQWVLDGCAAPGGKTTHLASLFPEAAIVANEVIRSRAAVLRENVQKWGCGNILVTNNDPEDFKALNGFFDLVVVDAPCSGEGLFRKNPAAQAEWSPQHVQLCAGRQQRILEAYWQALKPGGVLVYSTCTYNQTENEAQLEWLCQVLQAQPFDWQPTALDGAEWTETPSGVGCVRCYPHRVAGEGFFIGAVQKPQHHQRPQKPLRLQEFKSPPFAGELVGEWLFTLQTERLQAWPRRWELPAGLEKLRILSAPLEVAEQKGKHWKPLPGLALSTVLKADSVACVELDYRQALAYLRGETLHDLEVSAGWQLVGFQGWSLGWVKQTEQRANNAHPAGWRIQKPLKSEFFQTTEQQLLSLLPLRHA